MSCNGRVQRKLRPRRSLRVLGGYASKTSLDGEPTMSYASCLENIIEQVNQRLPEPCRPISQVKDGSTTGRETSNAQCESLATLPSDLTRPLNEQVGRSLENPRFRDKFVPPSLSEATASSIQKAERFEATNKQLRRNLKEADRRAKERDQLLREFKDRVADLESTNKRREELYAGAQERISELEAVLTQCECEIRKLRQENDALCFKEGMRHVRPLRHSA